MSIEFFDYKKNFLAQYLVTLENLGFDFYDSYERKDLDNMIIFSTFKFNLLNNPTSSVLVSEKEKVATLALIDLWERSGLTRTLNFHIGLENNNYSFFFCGLDSTPEIDFESIEKAAKEIFQKLHDSVLKEAAFKTEEQSTILNKLNNRCPNV